MFATSAFSEDVWGLGMWTIFIAWSSREHKGWSIREAVRGGDGLAWAKMEEENHVEEAEHHFRVPQLSNQ